MRGDNSGSKYSTSIMHKGFHFSLVFVGSLFINTMAMPGELNTKTHLEDKITCDLLNISEDFISEGTMKDLIVRS